MRFNSSKYSRVVFRAQLLALTVLSLWRIAICFGEYDAGPFVSVARTLLDQAPFWALVALAVAAYAGWHRASHPAGRLLIVGAGLLLVTSTDLLVFNGTARASLYQGGWVGEAKVACEEEDPLNGRSALHVTFTRDHQAVFTLGAGAVPVHRGEWTIAFDPLRCSQVLNFKGFGRGDYWNKENLYVRGTFTLGERTYRLSAHLKLVRPGRV